MARRWMGWAVACAVLAAMIALYLTDETERRGRLSPPLGPHPNDSGSTSAVRRAGREPGPPAERTEEAAPDATDAPAAAETF